MTHYLRFDSESTFRSAAFILGLCDEEGTYVQYTHDYAMDIIGIIYNNDTVIDSDGTVVTSATPIPGWHVNYIGELPEVFQPYAVTPQNPYRIFAGN